MKPTIDGGVIFGGESVSDSSGDKSQDAWSTDSWIIKVHSSGIKEWDIDYGSCSGTKLNAIELTADGGFILGGMAADSGCDKTQNTWGSADFWIIKIDSLGNKQWDKDFGTADYDNLRSIRQTKDGGYILGGITASGISGDKTQVTQGAEDYWVIKIDSAGNKQWDKDFGTAASDQLYSVIQTSDGGYILGGYTDAGISGDKSQPSWGLSDYWIVKTDSLGNKEWDKDLGGTDQDYFAAMEATADGGCILGGSSWSNAGGDKTQDTWLTVVCNCIYDDQDFWVLKLDSAGNKQWDKDFGGADIDLMTDLSLTADYGYLLYGTSWSGISGDKTEDNCNGNVEPWMIKINILGDKQLDKTAQTGLQYDYSHTGLAAQTTDGCYVIGWNVEAGIGCDKTQNNWGSGNPVPDDYWAVKFCDTSNAVSLLALDQNLCEKFCTSFYDQSTNNATSWQWLFPGGNPSSSIEKNPENICYYLPGVYDVTLITTGAGGTDTLTLTSYITVNATPPFPSITQNGNVLTCSAAAAYQWQLDGLNISGATQQSYTYSQPGLYTVLAYDSNGCSNYATLLITGVENLLNDFSVSVYPDPSHGKFIVAVPASAGDWISMDVINPLGEKIISQPFSPDQKNQMELSLPAAGNYFIEVKFRDNVVIKKVIIE
ncbi:MAG: T9SS type A sorting domain-containing protein [Chitinophagales bacterium]